MAAVKDPPVAKDEESNVGSDPGDSPRGDGDPPEDPPEVKKWPGTFGLGEDRDALTEANDVWQVKDGRKHLKHVAVPKANRTYKYLEMLGRGAQGYVFKMKRTDDAGSEIVAVKCYSKRRLLEEKERNCLHNLAIWHEFQLLKRVGSHSGIVQLEGTVMETEHYFYVPMEFVDGQDLHHLLWPRCGRPKPKLDGRALFRDIMKSLAFCHKEGVAHRDLKPGNILVTTDGKGSLTAKLMDFGLGAEVGKKEDGSPVKMRRPVGTTAWCAPEILKVFGTLMRSGGMGAKGAGSEWQDEQGINYLARPADIWSSGVLLWEMMTLDHLFHRPTMPSDKQGAHENRLVQSWKGVKESLEEHQKQLFERLPEKCRELLEGMLNPDYKKRPTAEQVLNSVWLKNKIEE